METTEIATAAQREVVKRNRFITRVEKYHQHAVIRQEQKAKKLSVNDQRAISVSEETGKNLSIPQQREGLMVKAKPKSVKFELTEARGAETHNQTGRLELAHAHKTTKAKQTACGIKEASFDEKNDGAVLSRSSKTIPSAILEVNLAAVAVQLKVRVKAADMPALLQEQAFRCARECLDSTEKLRCGRVALALKKRLLCQKQIKLCLLGPDLLCRTF